MPKVVIAGLGYIGKELACYLASEGFDVTGISRDPQNIAIPGVNIVAGDLTRAETLLEAAKTLPKQDFTIHCAASGRGGGEADYAAVYRGGVLGLLAAFPQSRLLFTSSTSVYPQIDGSLVTEDSLANPTRGTGKILRETEDCVLAMGGTVARLAGLYGPGRSFLLKNFLEGKSVIDRRTEPPETPDGRWINQIHRADVVAGLTHLLRLPAAFTVGQLFNLTDSRPYTQREVYTQMQARFGGQLPPAAPPDTNRKRGWTHKRVSNARIVSTGWTPRYPTFFDACEHDPEFLKSIR